MRSNFRSDIRLTKNIFFYNWCFCYYIKASIDIQVYEENNLCIKYLKCQVDRDTLIKKLKKITEQILLAFVTLFLNAKNMPTPQITLLERESDG